MEETRKATKAANPVYHSTAKVADFTDVCRGTAQENVPLPIEIPAGALETPQEKHLPFRNMTRDAQEFILKCAEVYQVSVDFATSGVLVAVAGAMGNRYKTRDAKGYINTPALWLCHVGRSGYGKSPIEKEVMWPIIERQKRLSADYKAKKAIWEASLQKGKGATDGQQESQKPIREKAFISDSTPEALYQALEDNPQGLMLFRDELAGWVADFGRYNKSGEIDNLLSIWSGNAIDTSRMTREGNFVDEPCLSVFGGTQPDRLSAVFGREVFMANGFNARMLWVYPEEQKPQTYSIARVPQDYKNWWAATIETLYQLPAQVVEFSPEAIKLYAGYYDATQLKIKDADPNMDAVLAKLPIYVERLAGIYHLLSDVTRDRLIAVGKISGTAMQDAIEAANVFEGWARKVYEKMASPQSLPPMTKENAIRMFDSYYPIENIQQFADSIGVSRQLISRALNRGDK